MTAPQLARDLHTAGVGVFPCAVKFDTARKKYTKRPVTPGGEDWRITAQRPIDDPAVAWAGCTVFGVVMPPGTVAVDLDTYKPECTREAAAKDMGAAIAWEATLMQTTIGGGEHHAFKTPEGWEVRQGSGYGASGFDTRVAGRGFICAGEGYAPQGFGLLRLVAPDSLPPLPDSCRPLLEKHAPTHARRNGTPVVGDLAEIRKALEHIDPDMEQPQWCRVFYMVKDHLPAGGEDVLAVLDEWSSGELRGEPSLKYSGIDNVTHQWDSTKPDGTLHIGTLFYEAAQLGYVPQRLDVAAAFGGGAAQTADVDALAARILEEGGKPECAAELVAACTALPGNPLQRAAMFASLHRELKQAGLMTPELRGELAAAAGLSAPKRPKAPALPAGQTIPAGQAIPPLSWARGHTKGEGMRPKGTRENFAVMLAAYGLTVEYDVIGKELRVQGPGLPVSGTLKDDAVLAHLDSLANLNEFPKGDVPAMLVASAVGNEINPVADWIDSAPWGGQDAVGELFGQLTLHPGENVAEAELLWRTWIRGAVAIGLGLTHRMEHVLVLVDPDGGAGKTRFFSSLCPHDLRKDSVTLDPSNKDSVKIATSYWLVELGELDATFGKANHARLKSFLSAEEDQIRLPYGRAYLKFPRHTAFFGSVNEPQFLVDASDNRRFWPIRITHADHAHDIDVQQVWAQAAAEVRAGQTWHLADDDKRRLAEHNERFRAKSRVVDVLSTVITAGGVPSDHLTITECLARGQFNNPLKSDLNEGAAWMRKNGWSETARNGKRGFLVPAMLPVSGVQPAEAFATPPPPPTTDMRH